jgi:hypothetical protein
MKNIGSIKEILERRTEIEKYLVGFLVETKSDFTLENIKEMIYEEDDTEILTDILSMFDIGQGAMEMDNIMETINDAWNYFPHKILGGLSPAEKLLGL